MAKAMSPEAANAKNQKRQISDEKKRLKKEQKEQRKEAKRRADEIARMEEDLDDGGANPFITFGATLLIIALWLAVICIIVKLDVGGFGSSVLTPLLKNVPVVNRILPGNVVTETTSPENGSYSGMDEAVGYIRQLELELERAQNEIKVKDSDIELLLAEKERLEEFEKAQVEFQRIVNEFYTEVVTYDKSPGIEAYQKWYETMNPSTAEYLYKQVLTQSQVSARIQQYAQTYSSASMKPKQAAAIFEEMTNDLELVAKILNAMSVEDRGEIMGAMNSEVAAKLTKIMDPDS